MKMMAEIPVLMLAPCGMNCLVCYAHLRRKSPCPGCRANEAGKPAHCRTCPLKECACSRGIEFCGQCAEFPCAAMKRLDKSYRQRYQVSLIENAHRILAAGPLQHLLEEKKRWTCPACDGVVSLHDRFCSECGNIS